MSDNLEIYNKYRKVPKNALKSFNNGSFKGTDINTMWRIKSLTEAFGACGIGWYTELIRQWSEPAPNDELLCFVEIKMHIKVDGEWGKGFSAIGGSKVVQYFSTKDYVKGNDEGYKMAYTDALGVACKYLGMGADVYWDNDKTKYTDEEPEQYKDQSAESATEKQIFLIKSLVKDTNAVLKYYNGKGYNLSCLEDIPKNLASEIIKAKQGESNA